MSISLLGSINVCKVNTGWADKLQSDRFENPNNMTCPLWSGQDTYGRFVSPDSFYTKTAGCASADDRVAVENFLRPQYMEYVALDAAGFQAPLYAGVPNAYAEAPRPNVMDKQFAAAHGGMPNQNMGMPMPKQQVVEGFVDHRKPYNYPQPRAIQQVNDTLCTRQQTLNNYRIVGSAGYDYLATNTPYDTGINGVNGGSTYYGCGRGSPTVMIQENFEDCVSSAPRSNVQPSILDNLADAKFDQRRGLSAIQGYKSNYTRCNGGF